MRDTRKICIEIVSLTDFKHLLLIFIVFSWLGLGIMIGIDFYCGSRLCLVRGI